MLGYNPCFDGSDGVTSYYDGVPVDPLCVTRACADVRDARHNKPQHCNALVLLSAYCLQTVSDTLYNRIQINRSLGLLCCMHSARRLTPDDYNLVTMSQMSWIMSEHL